MQDGHWRREVGDISKATSRATLCPRPGRCWQHIETEKLTQQLGQVCGNPLSKSQLRVKLQGSDPKTPTLYPSLHPKASYSKEIFFSCLSLPDCFFSSSFPHSEIPLFPPSSAFPTQIPLPGHDTLTLHHLPIHPHLPPVTNQISTYTHTRALQGLGTPGYELHLSKRWKRSWGQKKKANVRKKVAIW